MTCIVEGDQDVPVASYGRSNSGMMKRVYRIGLGYRYGRTMQTIAGVHYNYSAPDALWPLLERLDPRRDRAQDAVSEHYLALVRNFRRAGWQRVPVAASKDARVLERALFRLDLSRQGKAGEMFVLAEAWRGDRIADAIRHYFELDRGLHVEILRAGER